jgi:eukaryotic-like serine/threonine-protein kinase
VEDLAPDEFLPPAPCTLEPGTIVGEYRIETKLGDGGMATVYGATHPLIGKKAAIKVMSPSLSADAGAVARFALEARSVNRIGHPNIVDVFSYGRLPDGRSYFVMEWLQGETLYERLWKQHGPLPLTDVLNILDQICDALEATHEKGIIHRDLKPANVFLCPVRGRQDVVKLLDFGVAKLAHHDSSPRWTSAGCVVGTPEYISPEQARGKDVDARTDLYALGVIAYEMVLGRQPFISDNPADAIQMHLCATAPRPSILWKRIPRPLEALLLKLLAKRADERATLAEVRATLAALRPTVTQALDRIDDAPPPEVPLPRRRNAARLGAVALTFLLMAFAGYRPSKLRAQKLHTGQSVTAPVAAEVRPPADPNASSPAAASPSLAPPAIAKPSAPAAAAPAAPAPRKTRRHRRDGNYLLDPFPR